MLKSRKLEERERGGKQGKIVMRKDAIGAGAEMDFLMPLISKKEAAKFLSCSISTLNRLIMKKEVLHYKWGGRVFSSKGDLVKFIEAHKIRCL